MHVGTSFKVQDGMGNSPAIHLATVLKNWICDSRCICDDMKVIVEYNLLALWALSILNYCACQIKWKAEQEIQ